MSFVIIDLDGGRSRRQQTLVKKYYRGSIPHVVVLDAEGRAVYNAAGEVDERQLADLLDSILKR